MRVFQTFLTSDDNEVSVVSRNVYILSGMSLDWGLSDVSLVIRPDLWVLRRKFTEVILSTSFQ